MSLRLRLALAFFLLSALPLAGFAAYSYISSRAALREAAQVEAEGAARDLEQRVTLATTDLDRRLRALSTLPIETWVARADTGEQALAPELVELRAALPYLDGLRFVADLPSPPEPAEAPATPAPRSPPSAPGAARQVRVHTFQAGVGSEGFRLEIEKLQTAAFEAAIAAAELKGETLHKLGLEKVALRFEARARQLETAAVAPAAAAQDDLTCSVSDGQRVVGQLRAKIKGKQLFQSILGRIDRRRGEIPFALGEGRELYAASSEDAARLEQIPALAALRHGTPAPAGADDWIVVARRDPATGYQLGIARPLSNAMAQLRAAVARNFALGMALVGVALAGFFPLTGRLVRDVGELERGAARIAAGDLATRVTVRRHDELGRLGASFNRMADELVAHQEQLVAEERRRKEEEIGRRLLEAENERRGRELEEARQFQLALLPRELPHIPGLDIAVEMTTATEVGGDYYDFQSTPEGDLVLAIGDATGHGAAAGTLVTAVKSLFAAGATALTPAAFLVSANAAIHRMGLVRRAMALGLARFHGSTVRLSLAGMPPVLHFQAATGEVREIALPGTPLGARAEFPYAEVELELAAGDALLFASDGLPELPNGDGEPFGYERLRATFGELGDSSACEIVSGLRAAARAWGGDRPPVDDVTLLVVRAT